MQRGPDAPPERVRVKTYLAGNLDRLPDVGLGGAQATATAEEQGSAAGGGAGGADEERGDTGDDARDAGTDLTFDHGASTSCMDDDDDDDAEVTPEKVVPARPKRTLLGALGGGLRPPGSTPKRSAAPVRLTPPPELATSGEGASGGLIATDAERSDAPAPPVHVPMVDVALGDGEQQDDTGALDTGDPETAYV